MSATEAFFVTRTMQAIEVLAFQPCSAPQVAGALKVHPRTARRLLNKLVAEGWLTRSEGRRRIYAPTMRIVALAAQLAERDPLALAALPAVTRLHEETGLTAHLAIPSYRSTLCLVHRAGGPDARPQLRELVPVHATAAGKVLLAHRDPWRADVLSRPLEPVTTHTLVDAGDLEAEAARTAERGHAVEDGEFLPGLRGVAVPVRDTSGAVPAALAVAGPDTELELDLVDGLVELLQARAAEIERSLKGDERG
jgi:IclR family transcriptional regulator, KDG regulon repressor